MGLAWHAMRFGQESDTNQIFRFCVWCLSASFPRLWTRLGEIPHLHKSATLSPKSKIQKKNWTLPPDPLISSNPLPISTQRPPHANCADSPPPKKIPHAQHQKLADVLGAALRPRNLPSASLPPPLSSNHLGGARHHQGQSRQGILEVRLRRPCPSALGSPKGPWQTVNRTPRLTSTCGSSRQAPHP